MLSPFRIPVKAGTSTIPSSQPRTRPAGIPMIHRRMACP